MTVLGSRLPEPYFTLAVTASEGSRRFRRCLTCGYVYTTVEIALGQRPEGTPADCCQHHPRTKSVYLATVTTTTAIEKNKIARGVLMAVSMGAVWRRRGCRLNYFIESKAAANPKQKPEHQLRCKDVNGRAMRWTTLEVDSSGVVQKDISLCSRCGGKTRSYRGTHERFETWRDTKTT